MSLFGKIATMFSGGSARRICVVDGDRMVGGDKMGPSERFQALNKLSRFAGREKMDMRVVFGGRPLREAKEGSVFNGVRVFYGESADQVRKKLNKQLGSAGRSKALLVTADKAIEDEGLRKGYSTMRVSTLRKALEAGSSEGGSGSGGRDSNRRGRGGRGRGRRSGDRPNRSPQNTRSSDDQNRPQENAPADNASDSVKNLIDLVE